MIWKAFVSHDADTGDDDASHLKESLENRGISTFIDHKDIPGGEPRDSTIFHALDHCEYFIALGTDPYLESRPIRDEIQRAHDLEKKGQIKLILPCRHDGLVERDAFLALFPGEQLWEIAYSTESDLASRVLARLKGMEYRGAQTAPMVDGMATEALKRPWRPTEEFLRQQKERLEGGEATEVIPAVEAWLKREKRDVTGATALLARAFMVEGDGYFHKGEFRAAQGLYQKGLEYAEQSPDKTLVAMAAYELGAAWGMLGYYDEALKLFDRAIAAGFKHAPAYYNRGNAYYHKKEFDAAIADYTRAIELDPKDAAAYYNRGNAYDDKKDFDAAIADYTRAIELDPNDAAAYYNRGNAHAHKKELDAAIADYTRAIELDPKDAVAYNNRGNAHAHKKELDAAIADYTRAIELDPNYAQAYYNRGTAYAHKKEFDAAIADLTAAIKIDPKDAAAIANLGFAFMVKGDRRQARRWLRRALERRQELPDGGAAAVQAVLAELEKGKK